jgi:hypothetical protein
VSGADIIEMAEGLVAKSFAISSVAITVTTILAAALVEQHI